MLYATDLAAAWSVCSTAQICKPTAGLLCVQGEAGTNGANNLQQLLSNRPDAVNPIIGYNILPGTHKLAELIAGKSFDTTDTAKSGNSVQGTPQTLTVNVTSNSGSAAQVCSVILLFHVGMLKFSASRHQKVMHLCMNYSHNKAGLPARAASCLAAVVAYLDIVSCLIHHEWVCSMKCILSCLCSGLRCICGQLESWNDTMCLCLCS